MTIDNNKNECFERLINNDTNFKWWRNNGTTTLTSSNSHRFPNAYLRRQHNDTKNKSVFQCMLWEKSGLNLLANKRGNLNKLLHSKFLPFLQTVINKNTPRLLEKMKNILTYDLFWKNTILEVFSFDEKKVIFLKFSCLKHFFQTTFVLNFSFTFIPFILFHKDNNYSHGNISTVIWY